MCLVGKADDVSVSGRTKRRRDVMGRGGVERGVPEHSHCSSHQQDVSLVAEVVLK